MAESPWYRDDPTPPQRRALKALASTAKGGGYIRHFRHVAKAQTFRAMSRLGLITAEDDRFQSNTFVWLTEHGRACAQDGGPLGGTAPATSSATPELPAVTLEKQAVELLGLIARRTNEYRCPFCGHDGLEDDGEHEEGELCSQVAALLDKFAALTAAKEGGR